MGWYGSNSCNGRLAYVLILHLVSTTLAWAESTQGTQGVHGQMLEERPHSSSSNDSLVLLQVEYVLERPSRQQNDVLNGHPRYYTYSDQAWPDAGSAWRGLTGRPDAAKALKAMGAHPFWHLEMNKLWDARTVPCCAVMAVAGVLCSAGGIGGGGIYVSVLMVVGRIALFDAVPLSQAIIFIGSIPTLLMNLRKGQESPRRLIDFNLCRVVVPLSLSGTFLGVILNRHLPGCLTLSVLTAMLVFMTVSMVCETIRQYANEHKTLDTLSDVSSEGGCSDGGSSGDAKQGSMSGGSSAMLTRLKRQVSDPAGRIYTWCDVWVLVSILALVISAGVIRFHSSRCARSPVGLRSEYCNHRALFWLPFGIMEHWVFTENSAPFISGVAMVVPLVVCSSVGLAYATLLVKQNTWTLSSIATYSSMAFGTGILSGLLGIGGGLIFSPFFLLMGAPPAIAVATSSTCVLISSSSSALQYLLTDRVVMSLALLYGAVNLVSSSIGTKLVHFLQDRMGTSKWLISGIVALGVLLSTMLTVVKLWSKLKRHDNPQPTIPSLLVMTEYFPESFPM